MRGRPGVVDGNRPLTRQYTASRPRFHEDIDDRQWIPHEISHMSSACRETPKRVHRVKPSWGGESASSASSTSCEPLPLSIDPNLPARPLMKLVRTASTFYGSQFAFRTRLPPPKQLADNLPTMYPSLSAKDQAFVLEMTAAIEKESRMINAMLDEITGLRQCDRDIDGVIIYILLMRLDAFGIGNVRSLCTAMPTKMATVLRFLARDTSRGGPLFASLIKHHDIRTIERRILGPLERLRPAIVAEMQRVDARLAARRAAASQAQGEAIEFGAA